MAKQEKIQLTIPASNKWHTEDIEKRAEMYGLKKTGFILMAIDAFLQLKQDDAESILDFIAMQKIIEKNKKGEYSITLKANGGD